MDAAKRVPNPQTLKILDLRRKGLMHKEIADFLGCSKDTVKWACRQYGLTKDHSVTENDAEKTVRDLGFDYVGGFTSTKGKVTLMCRECGGIFERYYDAVRNDAHGKRKEKITCPHCYKKTHTKERDRKQAQHERAEREAHIRAQRKAEQLSRQLEKRLAIHVCKNCGAEYCKEVTGYNSNTYCSKRCQQRWHERIKNDNRMHMMLKREHDTDITLERLYQRDGGVCYICGNVCDWSDITEKNGTLIAGKNYPSIDHVKPVSKGGTHTWNNIKLACRHCNSLKGWK